jgi:hypothetical protein
MARACAPSAPSFAERALPELDALAAKPAPVTEEAAAA